MTGMFDAEVPAFVGWTVPEGWTPTNIARCRSCGADVLWCITPKGKHAPVNADGTSHFSNCPQSDQWRRRA